MPAGQRLDQAPDRVGVAGGLQDRRDAVAGAEDERAVVADESARVVLAFHGGVRALPGRPLRRAADGVRDRHRGDVVLLQDELVERPDLELAHDPVAELLVEPDRRLVLDEHLEPELLDPARHRPVFDRPHQLLADPLAASTGNDADAADPA